MFKTNKYTISLFFFLIFGLFLITLKEIIRKIEKHDN